MSQPLDFDVVIVGAGLAGASLACALRGSRFRVGLIEPAPAQPPAGWDARIYAISPVNVTFLERCGAWAHIDASRIQPVERMLVYGDAGGALNFSAYESGMDALAWIVESSRMASELWETARRQPNITVFAPAQPAALTVDAQAALLTLADGRVLRSRLIVGADGANSWVRTQAGLPVAVHDYHELGVVANFACSQAHRASAYQWFGEHGVLAYLPLPGNHISMVWSTPKAQAEALLALSAEELAAKVAQAGGHALGALHLITPAQGFALRLRRMGKVSASRLALIGDAAHGVHPLSGHGINLGFQDARALADELLALPAFRDCGEAQILARYGRVRAEETMLVQGVTHGLHQLFKPTALPLVTLRNAGMRLAGGIPLLRSMAARYASGLW